MMEATTRAEIGFEEFPCGPCATEADRVLRSLEGVLEVHLNASVGRATIFFDPTRVKIPALLSTLQSLKLNPKLVSLIMPAGKVA